MKHKSEETTDRDPFAFIMSIYRLPDLVPGIFKFFGSYQCKYP